jgi:hypothetical protein
LPDSLPSIKSLLAQNQDQIAAELLEKLHPFIGPLDGRADPPLEEWRSWLEPLIKRVEDGQPIDLNALFEAISSMTQEIPSTRRSPDTLRKKRVKYATRRRRKSRQG